MSDESRLSGDPRAHFHSLTRDEQAAAIRRLADEGLGEYTIAHACGLAVEQVRAILGERNREARR